MNTTRAKKIKRVRRHNRVRSKISGTLQRPRLSVFRANAHMYAQLIDDENRKTLASASSIELKATGNKTEIASKVGELISKKALALNVTHVVFDRGGL